MFVHIVNTHWMSVRLEYLYGRTAGRGSSLGWWGVPLWETLGLLGALSYGMLSEAECRTEDRIPRPKHLRLSRAGSLAGSCMSSVWNTFSTVLIPSIGYISELVKTLQQLETKTEITDNNNNNIYNAHISTRRDAQDALTNVGNYYLGFSCAAITAL